VPIFAAFMERLSSLDRLRMRSEDDLSFHAGSYSFVVGIAHTSGRPHMHVCDAWVLHTSRRQTDSGQLPGTDARRSTVKHLKHVHALQRSKYVFATGCYARCCQHRLTEVLDGWLPHFRFAALFVDVQCVTNP
jgi:hypothetical protein